MRLNWNDFINMSQETFRNKAPTIVIYASMLGWAT